MDFEGLQGGGAGVHRCHGKRAGHEQQEDRTQRMGQLLCLIFRRALGGILARTRIIRLEALLCRGGTHGFCNRPTNVDSGASRAALL